MNPELLVLVDSDPRTSPRPAEAIRIAAGVGAWKRVLISIYLHGPAVLVLREWVDELLDEDNFTSYLPIVRDFERPVYVEKGNPLLDELGEPSLRFAELDTGQLAALCARHQYVLRF